MGVEQNVMFCVYVVTNRIISVLSEIDAHNYKIIGMLKTIVFIIPMILKLCASVGIIKSALILLMHGANMKITANKFCNKKQRLRCP